MKFERELTPEELAQLPDEEIDYSDIPELDESFFSTSKLEYPPFEATQTIPVGINKNIIDYFKQFGEEYEHQINIVLLTHIKQQKA